MEMCTYILIDCKKMKGGDFILPPPGTYEDVTKIFDILVLSSKIGAFQVKKYPRKIYTDNNGYPRAKLTLVRPDHQYTINLLLYIEDESVHGDEEDGTLLITLAHVKRNSYKTRKSSSCGHFYISTNGNREWSIYEWDTGCPYTVPVAQLLSGLEDIRMKAFPDTY